MKKWYSKTSNWLMILFAIIIIPLVFIFGTIIVKTKLYPESIPDFFGYKPMIVLSGSMEKNIYAGDLAIVKIVEPESLKVKDIIAFRNKDNTVTLHRIIKINNENNEISFTTKGDNNNVEDDNKVYYKDIEGIFLRKINGLGNVLLFIQKPLGLIGICVVIMCVGVTLTLVVNDRKISKKELKEFEEYKKNKERCNQK